LRALRGVLWLIGAGLVLLGEPMHGRSSRFKAASYAGERGSWRITHLTSRYPPSRSRATTMEGPRTGKTTSNSQPTPQYGHVVRVNCPGHPNTASDRSSIGPDGHVSHAPTTHARALPERVPVSATSRSRPSRSTACQVSCRSHKKQSIHLAMSTRMYGCESSTSARTARRDAVRAHRGTEPILATRVRDAFGEHLEDLATPLLERGGPRRDHHPVVDRYGP
jgi:hypothetical protein